MADHPAARPPPPPRPLLASPHLPRLSSPSPGGIRSTLLSLHLVRDLRESFWGDLYGQARGTLEKFLSRESVRLRDEAVGCERFQQKEERRGLSTRQVGRVVAILTDEVVSAQTVSKLTRSLDHLVRA